MSRSENLSGAAVPPGSAGPGEDALITQRFVGRADAAKYIRGRYGFPCSAQWLAKLAVIGGGPPYRKAGRHPIYDPTDLDAWAMSRIGQPISSTSEAETAA